MFGWKRRRNADAALIGKTSGEILEDPQLIMLAFYTLGPFSRFRLHVRHVMHFGLYLKLRKRGLSDEQAGAACDLQRPMTFWDHVYLKKQALTHVPKADAKRMFDLLEDVSSRVEGGHSVTYNDQGEVFVHPELMKELKKPENAHLEKTFQDHADWYANETLRERLHVSTGASAAIRNSPFERQ